MSIIITNMKQAVDMALVSRELNRMATESLMFGKVLTEEESAKRIKKVVENTSEEERKEIEDILKSKYVYNGA